MRLDPLVFDETSVINNKLLEVAKEKGKVIANNIANAETPGYTRFELEYEKSLKNAIDSGNANEINHSPLKAIKDDTGPKRSDGNNVVVAKEMMAMMDNSVLTSLLTKTFSTRISILKSAISNKV